MMKKVSMFIKNIPVFIYQNGRHSVLDNDIFIKNGEKYR